VVEPIVIEDFLPAETLADWRCRIAQARFEDGGVSAGRWAQGVKRNKQARSREVEQFGAALVGRLFEDERIARSVYPYRATQPLFNRYDAGDFYGLHEDNPIQSGLRADVSYTLFLSDTADYEGGGLRLGPGAGTIYRLQGGGLILYDAGTPHQVEPVTDGTRLAAVGWIQSVVRDPAQRALLRSFYRALSDLDGLVGSNHSAFCDLNRIRNQLTRAWVDL
jgi:PKHD-type hydroxylase